jgi:hypothetical protein
VIALTIITGLLLAGLAMAAAPASAACPNENSAYGCDRNGSTSVGRFNLLWDMWDPNDPRPCFKARVIDDDDFTGADCMHGTFDWEMQPAHHYDLREEPRERGGVDQDLAGGRSLDRREDLAGGAFFGQEPRIFRQAGAAWSDCIGAHPAGPPDTVWGNPPSATNAKEDQGPALAASIGTEH